MLVGSIVFATQSGLGIQARAFFDHKIIDRVMVMDHPHYENLPKWYPVDDRFIAGQTEEFLDGLDCLLLFENAIDWGVVEAAKSRRTPVILQPNYEYTPQSRVPLIDHFICPSKLDLRYFPSSRSSFLPVPVDVPWRKRERAMRFIHNAGHGGVKFRNGTPELLESMRYVQSPIELTVRGQPGIRQGGSGRESENRVDKLFREFKGDPRVKLVLADVPDEELYQDGDVFIFPEKFNGLSLPLQEARAAGMLVMAADRYPMNDWLPRSPLIPVSRYEQDQIEVKFDRAVIDPRAIARTIDKWYGEDISDYSESGREWAETMSWEVLGPQYLSLLEGVKCH